MKYKCTKCNNICNENEILSDYHPFDPLKIVNGCPKCKEINSLKHMCSVADCDKIGSWGKDTGESYNYFCLEHFKEVL